MALSRTQIGAAIAVLFLSVACACKKEPAPDTAAAKEPAATQSTAVDTQNGTGDGAANDNAAKVTLPQPFLWRVESPNGKISHLMGTMHLGIDAKSELGSEVWDAFGAANTFVMEMDITDATLTMTERTDGKTLRDEIGDKAWALLEKHLGFMASGMNSMKPSDAALALVLQGLPMTMPMDLAFHNDAKKAGKTMVYLETVAEQQAILDALFDAKTLVTILEDMKEVKKMNGKMLETYRVGDADKLVKLMHEDNAWFRSTPQEKAEAMDKFLFKRNANWISKLEPLLAEGGAFIAVGAAHLPGERGINKLLRAKGFKVTRVAPAAPEQKPAALPAQKAG